MAGARPSATIVPLLVIPPKKVATPSMAIPLAAEILPVLMIKPSALLVPNRATRVTRMPSKPAEIVPALLMLLVKTETKSTLEPLAMPT